MAIEINMPKLGLSMQEGIVGKWLKNEGDTVKKGEPLLEIMTDKITNQVDAPADGVLLRIVAIKKSKLPIGGLLGVIGEAGEDISEILNANSTISVMTASAAQGAVKKSAGQSVVGPAGDGNLKISPAARKLAQDHGIDYTSLVGTGPEGRITREDIEKVIAEPCMPESGRSTLEVIPYEGMRQVIGDNMANSWSAAPKVTHHVSVDMSALMSLRATINQDHKEIDKISVTDILVKAVAKALELHPRMNSTLEGEEIKVWADINIGVAVAIPNGLLVPVVRNANKKNLDEVSRTIKNFAKQAKRNKLDPGEMKGGTFTVTNLGGYGSVDWFTPIINQPESAILGIGRTVKKPVIVDDQVVVRPMMGLSLSFDHRVIDGAPAAEFLGYLLKLIEQPHRIFI